MDATATHHVNQIPADEKRTLETLLGSTLEPQKHVLILAYIPNLLPTENVRQAARDRIVRMITANQQLAAGQGVSIEEADASVEEAMTQVRHPSAEQKSTLHATIGIEMRSVNACSKLGK